MRTTVTIEDSLLERARQASLQRNCSIGEVIEDSLRITLVAQSKSAFKEKRRPLRTFRGSGVQPGVDLTSSSALLEAME